MESQIISDLLSGGSKARLAESTLFEQYQYIVREGMRKFPKLSHEEASSCYCDALLAMIDSIRKGSFEGAASIKTYLTRIFLNKCVDVSRKNTTNRSVVNRGLDIDLAAHFPASVVNAVQSLVSKGELDRLMAKLERLGEPCKSILLAIGNAFSYSEIAEMLGYKSSEVVRTQVGRCRGKLIIDN